MAEEEETPTTDEPQDAAETASPSEAGDAPEADASAEPPAEEAAAAPAQEPAGEAAPAPAQPAAEPVAPKERRRRTRQAKAAAAPTRPAQTPQERQAERDAERRRKAALRRTRRSREHERAQARRSGTPAPDALPALRPTGAGQQKTRQGIVVSDRAAKTITVRIDVTRRHPRYQKVVRTSTTLHAHDEQGDAHIGDTVVIKESRPLSRTKRWRLVEVLERAK